MINREKLVARCGFETDVQLRKNHLQWVGEAIHTGSDIRHPRWTESIAVGSEEFVQGVQQTLQRRAEGRKVREGIDHYELREPGAPYDVLLTQENRLLRARNGYYWNEMDAQSIP